MFFTTFYCELVFWMGGGRINVQEDPNEEGKVKEWLEYV